MYGTLFGAFAGGLGLYMKLLLQPLEFQIASNQNTLVGLGKELKEAEARQKDALANTQTQLEKAILGHGKELRDAEARQIDALASTEARQKDALVRLENLFKDAEMRQGSSLKEAEGRQIAALKAQGNELRGLQNIFRTEGYFKSAKAPESKPFIQ